MAKSIFYGAHWFCQVYRFCHICNTQRQTDGQKDGHGMTDRNETRDSVVCIGLRKQAIHTADSMFTRRQATCYVHHHHHRYIKPLVTTAGTSTLYNKAKRNNSAIMRAKKDHQPDRQIERSFPTADLSLSLFPRLSNRQVLDTLSCQLPDCMLKSPFTAVLRRSVLPQCTRSLQGECVSRLLKGHWPYLRCESDGSRRSVEC